VADSLWLDRGFELKPAFRTDLEELYRSEAFDIDFNAAGSAEPVNQWVSRRTEGLIDQILTQEDTRDLLLYLLNALYFNGQWTDPPSPERTAEADFALADGQTVKAQMMTFEMGHPSYIKLADGSEGALLKYAGGRFALVAIMPAGGPDAVGAVEWDGQTVAGWLGQAQERGNLTVKLPKWEADSGRLDLVPALQATGLSQAFDSQRADFSNLAEVGPGDIFLGGVDHRAVIKVNEVGTEAAAVTGARVYLTSAPSDEPLTVEFNRPFVYSIVDTETSLPLFLGAVNNPTQP
jgi:serpin B